MRKIQEMIDDLSPEEREKFKELIDECLGREKEIIESRDRISSSVESLTKSIESTCNSLCEMEKNILLLKDELKAIEIFSNSTIDKGNLN